MGIKQLYNDNLRKLPNKYGDVSVMVFAGRTLILLVLSDDDIDDTVHLYLKILSFQVLKF